MCKKLFLAAKLKRLKLDAPTRIYPGCHPKAAIEVFVDSVQQTVILSCAKCDRTISTIHAKGLDNGDSVRPNP